VSNDGTQQHRVARARRGAAQAQQWSMAIMSTLACTVCFAVWTEVRRAEVISPRRSLLASRVESTDHLLFDFEPRSIQ
jgi:hypothetical protein